MPIATNARAAADKRIAKNLVQALAPEIGDAMLDIKFLKTKVKIETDDQTIDLDRDEFNAWADAGYPWDAANGQPGAPTEEPEPEPEPEPERRTPPRKAADPADVLDELATAAFEIEQEELSGQHGRNVARYKRGELMLRLHSIAKASKVDMKDLLGELNRRTLAIASRHQVAKFDTITEQEASTMRKVVQAFGSSGEFKNLYGIDPATGNPMVRDDGQPYEVPLTEIAPNKLAPLTKYADEMPHDELLSFAFNTTEKIVKKAKAVAKATDTPFSEVMGTVLSLRQTVASPLGEAVGDIEVPADEATVLAALRDMAGEQPPEDVASIKTSRAWYEGTWLPIKALATSIAREFMPDRIPEGADSVPNVLILERILTQFYSPYEDDGVKRLLAVFVEAEDITETQAVEFLRSFAFDPETDEWVRVKPAAEPDEFDLDDDDEEDDDEVTDDDFDVEDDDFDLDTPDGDDDDF